MTWSVSHKSLKRVTVVKRNAIPCANPQHTVIITQCAIDRRVRQSLLHAIMFYDRLRLRQNLRRMEENTAHHSTYSDDCLCHFSSW